MSATARYRKTATLLASGAGALVLAASFTAASWAGELRNDEQFGVIGALAVPVSPNNNTGNALVSFDISFTDPVLHRYYLGDRSNKSVDVIDTTQNNQVTQFSAGFVGFTGKNDTSGPDGVMTVDHKQLWVGDGMSRVWVLDALTGAVVTLPNNAPNPIPTSTNNPNRADELCYDPRDHLVMIANNADDPPFASFISTKTYTVVGKIAFDGTNGAPKSTNGAEQCGWSPRTGMFYMSVPGVHDPDDGTGAVAVIDPIAKKVVNTFVVPVEACAAPQGLAMGPDPQIMLGCNGKSPNGAYNTAIINEHSGKVIASLANEGGNDEVWYNPGDGHYFLAGGSHRPSEQLGIADSQWKSQDQTITTGFPNGTSRSAHSVAADANTNVVYMPIPANGGSTTVGFQSNLCGAMTGGCIALLGTTHDDRSRVARERDPDDHQE